MLPKYSPSLLFLMICLCYLGVVSNSASIFCHWRFVSIWSPLWLKITSWNLSGYFYSDVCPISNHSAIAQARVFSRLYFVSSCCICFRSVIIVLILHFFLVIAGHRIMWSLVSDCPHRQHLSWSSHFNFSSVVAVGSKSLQISTSTTSLFILFNPRFKRFHAIEFIVLLFHLLLSVGGNIYTFAPNRLWWGGVAYYFLLPFHWLLTPEAMMDICEWLGCLRRAHLDILLLVSTLLHSVLLLLTFFFSRSNILMSIHVLEWCFNVVGLICQVDLFYNIKFSYQIVVFVRVSMVQMLIVFVDEFYMMRYVNNIGISTLAVFCQ